MKSSGSRGLVMLLAKLTASNSDLPRFLQSNPTIRRFGMKFLPYLILIAVALIVEYSATYLIKGSLVLGLFLFIYGYAL